MVNEGRNHNSTTEDLYMRVLVSLLLFAFPQQQNSPTAYWFLAQANKKGLINDKLRCLGISHCLENKTKL